ERAEADEAVGKENKRLLDRWMCNDERCINSKLGRGYCYIDVGGAHYNMDQNQQLKWAKAIQQGETGVSIEIPPRSLYINWTKNQGPVDGNSKASIKAKAKAEAKSSIDELKELLLQAPMAPIAPTAPPPPSSAPPAAIQGPPAPPERPRSSSPIAPAEEAANLEELFFRWKLSTVAKDKKEEYKAVERTILQRRYKLAYIKAMSSPQNPMFHRAIELGIPDGIALNFKEDLKLFKTHWRQQSAARLLTSLRQN
ncbi:MAG: hypothetical protein Q9171_006402, partial [Xanthocarpia ochracea]